MIPDSASRAAVRMSAQGANDPGGDSPFAILLAASAQQMPAPQASNAPPVDDALDAATATTDIQNNIAAPTSSTVLPTLPGVSQDQTASADDGKPGKAAGDKDRDDDVTAGPAQPFAQVAAALINDPSIAQIIQQKPGTVPDAAGPNVASGTPPGIARVAEKDIGWAARIGAGDHDGNDDKAEDTQIAAKPANGDPAIVASAPPPALNTGDDVSSDVPVAQDEPGDTRPATGKSVDSKSADTQSAGTQPAPQPGDDALAISQIVMTAPPAGAPANPSTSNNGRNDMALTQIAKAPPSQAEKPGANNTEPSNNTPQAPSATDAAPAAINGSTAPDSADGKKDAKSTDSIRTISDNDTKPAHITAPDAAPQPDAPVQVPHAASMPAPPQNLAATIFDAPNPVAGSDGTIATTSLHLASADADPTPNLGALAVSIAARSQSGAKQFEIRLDPPELGRVDVRLSIDASGKTQAHMTADQPQTLDLLQKDAPSLTQALRDAGLDVSQGGLNFSLRGQDRQTNDGGNGAPGRRTNLTASRTIQAAQGPAAISFNGAAADARLDIHV